MLQPFGALFRRSPRTTSATEWQSNGECKFALWKSQNQDDQGVDLSSKLYSVLIISIIVAATLSTLPKKIMHTVRL